MALTKELEYDCDVRGAYKTVQVRQITIIKDGGNEISRSYHRHLLDCCKKINGVWSNTDISGEPEEIQAVCGAVWTDSIRTAYKAYVDSQESSSEHYVDSEESSPE